MPEIGDVLVDGVGEEFPRVSQDLVDYLEKIYPKLDLRLTKNGLPNVTFEEIIHRGGARQLIDHLRTLMENR